MTIEVLTITFPPHVRFGKGYSLMPYLCNESSIAGVAPTGLTTGL